MGDAWLDRLLRWLRPLGVRWTPTGFLDLILRLGPYGDRFLPWSDGLNLEKLKAAPHGIDLGALQLGVGRRVYHRDKRIHLASSRMLEAIAVLERALDATAGENGLVLIGRRELRSNNSWMHNVPSLVSAASAASSTCIPTTPPATRSATASRRSSRAACIAARCGSRSPTTCAPEW